MNKQIEEMLHCIEMNCKHNKCFGGFKLDKEDCELLLKYIKRNDDKIETSKYLHVEYKKVLHENERLKIFITDLISTFNHSELNGTKKLDIVSDYIKQEYEKVLKEENK